MDRSFFFRSGENQYLSSLFTVTPPLRLNFFRVQPGPTSEAGPLKTSADFSPLNGTGRSFGGLPAMTALPSAGSRAAGWLDATSVALPFSPLFSAGTEALLAGATFRRLATRASSIPAFDGAGWTSACACACAAATSVAAAGPACKDAAPPIAACAATALFALCRVDCTLRALPAPAAAALWELDAIAPACPLPTIGLPEAATSCAICRFRRELSLIAQAVAICSACLLATAPSASAELSTMPHH
mmetsp:Transcript_49288/g.148377  ORF Transcript_49288/g.148377 Transcript_49288/m.148377 type:complete len:245 (+) Transcript_49288:1172-1906(+)